MLVVVVVIMLNILELIMKIVPNYPTKSGLGSIALAPIEFVNSSP
jgi:hypothetical protein